MCREKSRVTDPAGSTSTSAGSSRATASRSTPRRLITNLLPVLGAVVVCVLVVFATRHAGVRTPQSDSVPSRLAFAIRWLLFEVTCVFFGVAVIRRGSHQLLDESTKTYIENTLEQCVLSSSLVLLSATTLDREHLFVLPAVCITFVLGRLLFGLVYLYLGPAYTSYWILDFSTTITPSAALLVYNWYFFITCGPSFFL